MNEAGTEMLARVQLNRLRCVAQRGVRTTRVVARNRRFQSRLTHDPGGPLLILSPHLDDSVLNCWSVLAGTRDVRVVNVFTEVPPPGLLTHWDRVCGATDSATQMRRRIAEDIEAHAVAGRVPTNLGFLDLMYRRCAPPPAHVDIDAAVAAVLPAVSEVYAPVGVSHRDHRLVRSYAAAVARNGIPLCLYADLPYATRFGWPAWVTGSASDPHLDVDAEWDANPRIPNDLRPRVVTLGEAAAAAKLAAIRKYRSQLSALDAGPLQAISNPMIHGFEVFWDLT